MLNLAIHNEVLRQRVSCKVTAATGIGKTVQGKPRAVFSCANLNTVESAPVYGKPMTSEPAAGVLTGTYEPRAEHPQRYVGVVRCCLQVMRCLWDTSPKGGEPITKNPPVSQADR